MQQKKAFKAHKNYKPCDQSDHFLPSVFARLVLPKKKMYEEEKK